MSKESTSVLTAKSAFEAFDSAFISWRDDLFEIAESCTESMFDPETWTSNMYGFYPFDPNLGAINGVKAWRGAQPQILPTLLSFHLGNRGVDRLWVTRHAPDGKSILRGPISVTMQQHFQDEIFSRVLSQSKPRVKGVWRDGPKGNGSLVNPMRIRVPHE